MKMLRYIFLSLIGCAISVGCNRHQPAGQETNRELLAENDSIQILREFIDSAKDESDWSAAVLWIRNKTTGEETKLLQTVKPEWFSWYMGDGDRFYDFPIDSITAISRVFIHSNDPLQLIVEGCPDYRNEFSYFIDVPCRTARYIPANSGYVGGTEEGYMIFRSYRYVSDPDIAGRYTFLQIFNDDGIMVDSLDLEHVILENSNSPYAKK